MTPLQALAELVAVQQTIRMRLEVAHRLLDLATGPSGARAALQKITEAITDIDRATARAVLAQGDDSVAKAIRETAERCREMALWPQGIDDEQVYYGRMFAEFIEREFKLKEPT